jgi:hypothetical protein
MGKRFRVQRLKGGRRHVFETDSEADYLRCHIDELAGDFNVWCDVSVTERPDHWMRVELKMATTAPVTVTPTLMPIASSSGAATASPEGAAPDRSAVLRFFEFADEVGHIFASFYDREGADRGTTTWAWTVRHRSGCPWF